MMNLKTGFAIASIISAMAGCTPAQYEVAYNQVVDPFVSETALTRAQSALPAETETRIAPASVMASEKAQSEDLSDPVDFSQTVAPAATTQVNEKRFAEERDESGGGGAGGGSGGSWGG